MATFGEDEWEVPLFCGKKSNTKILSKVSQVKPKEGSMV